MATHTTRDGTRLFYRVRGRGAPTLVFIHGWCSNEGHWKAQLNQFGRSHRVLAIDRRGHGRSDVPNHGYSAAGHAADMLEILRKERVRSAVLVGHAGGFPATLELARTASAAVKAIVSIDARLGPAANLDDPKDLAGAAYRGMVDAIRGPNGRREFRRMYTELFSPHAGATGKQAVREACQVPREIAARELESLAVDTLSLARGIKQPVLWLTAGAEDESAITAAFPRARSLQVGQTVGSGHFPQLEVPDQIGAMLRRFIATL